jgi:hypothetical protein
MKTSITTVRPSTLFSRELKRVDITEVTKEQREDLYRALLDLFSYGKDCAYDLHLNSVNMPLKSQEEGRLFIMGFWLAMRLEGILLPSRPDYQYSTI